MTALIGVLKSWDIEESRIDCIYVTAASLAYSLMEVESFIKTNTFVLFWIEVLKMSVEILSCCWSYILDLIY